MAENPDIVDLPVPCVITVPGSYRWTTPLVWNRCGKLIDVQCRADIHVKEIIFQDPQDSKDLEQIGIHLRVAGSRAFGGSLVNQRCDTNKLFLAAVIIGADNCECSNFKLFNFSGDIYCCSRNDQSRNTVSMVSCNFNKVVARDSNLSLQRDNIARLELHGECQTRYENCHAEALEPQVFRVVADEMNRVNPPGGILV